jgi:hypothetical protein
MCGKVGHVINIDSFVNLDREEEEEGSMPSNSMPKALKKQQVHVLREFQVEFIH